MSEGITCYERDEDLCSDEMCLRTGCRLRNARLAAAGEQKPVATYTSDRVFEGKRPLSAEDTERLKANYTRTHGKAAPQPAAGWDQAIEAAIDIVKPWQGAEGFAWSEADKAVESIRRKFVTALESLRHNAPPDSGAGKSEKPESLFIEGWITDEFAAGRRTPICDVVMPDHGGADAGGGVRERDKFYSRSTIDDVWLCHDKARTSAMIQIDENQIRCTWDQLQILLELIQRRNGEALSNPASEDSNASGVLQNDLGEMLRALGMPDAAQPRSPHDVFQSALAEMKRFQLANASAEPKNALDWAVGRWNAEVLNRPLRNIHRRSLDDTWRQVIRNLGGDDRRLIGPPHDELLDSPAPHASDCDKQGEAPKTEFITGYFADQYKAGAKPHVGPSDRPADVTEEELTKFVMDNAGGQIWKHEAARIARALRAEQERDELKEECSAYASQNTNLRNDLVLSGMARDAAEQERDEAIAALKPMADVAVDIPEHWDDDAQCVTACGHFRRAATAIRRLAGPEKEKKE